MDIAANWVRECAHCHERCSQQNSTFPTRILDVGAANDIVNLVNGAGLTGTYACLSYCVRILTLNIPIPPPCNGVFANSTILTKPSDLEYSGIVGQMSSVHYKTSFIISKKIRLLPIRNAQNFLRRNHDNSTSRHTILMDRQPLYLPR